MIKIYTLEYLRNITEKYLKNKDKKVTEFGNEFDILEQVIKSIRESEAEGQAYDLFKVFKNDYFSIFYTLKKEFKYIKEPPEKQTSKTLARYIADGYGDCKHYATFTYSILKYSYPVRLKLVSWNGINPQHIFTEFKIQNEWKKIDPVFDHIFEGKEGAKQWIVDKKIW